GITVIDSKGVTQQVTPEEIEEMSGLDQPYLLQVGDQMEVRFRVRDIREGEAAWDYRLEVGDSMEVRFSPKMVDRDTYLVDVGDVIGISFLNNWPLNMNRTIRPDGKIGVTEVGDVTIAGLTAPQIEERLTTLYKKTEIIQGDPKINVNVDFANLDRLESMSRDVVIRPNGAISLPMLLKEIKIAGLTVKEATEAISAEAAKVLRNAPTVGLVVFPNINTVLAAMDSVAEVRPDGKMNFPRLEHEVQAAGYTVEEVRQAVAEACQGLIYNKADVSLKPVKLTGARIYVSGEVGVPGVYPLDATPTAMQAIVIARGPANTARMNNVIVMRRNPEGKPFIFRTNLNAALKKGYTDNDITLRPFDVVHVPMKLIVQADLFVERYIDRIVPFDNTMGVSGTYYMNEQSVRSKSKNVGASVVLSPTSLIPGIVP
ncbi:MAG: hypothetical protein GY851_06955, partial [bacterium]|nr:hypothetical protein [bacterium]